MAETARNALAHTAADKEAIQHLKAAISEGKHWYVALLEAIGLWGSAEEVHDGRCYRYLIGGEAFDWLALAERLCQEIDGLVPEGEKLDLLFAATPPIELSPGEFRDLIGEVKYRAYLNYLYGVVVEEALVSVVEEEVMKENGHLTLVLGQRIEQEAYRRIYEAEMPDLLAMFRSQRGYANGDSISLTEKKEFTYWLFKYRVEHSEKARVASDTRKALVWLQRQWSSSTKMKPVQTTGMRLLLGCNAGS
ncbi:MAG: hypothetical protein QUS33_07960 [Dehalococcoidia bacterium]|nr:hypothetical protein [Dehalococcoidia bacterium]